MSSSNVYEALRETLERAGGAVPAIGIDECFVLLKELVTPEEAALAASLPDRWVTAEAYAETLGRPPEAVAAMLETMTDNGFLHARKNSAGIYEYRIMPLLPGVYEMQFFRGTKTERDYRLARKFKDYFDALTELRDSLDKPPTVPSTSYFRVIPVEKEVQATTKVLPYAKLSKYVEQTDAIAVGTCFCRHHAALLDESNNCGASHGNCMAFGEGAVFVADRRMGRMIDKEEALRILEQAEEEGLVHCSANTSDELAFICNCCSCHCGILRQAKSAPHASITLTSGYNASIDAELCTACEMCVDRCPVAAITVEETASVDPLQCIGCGLCVDTCPAEAIELAARPDAQTPPGRLKDLKAARSAR
jgi:ferredoxin